MIEVPAKIQQPKVISKYTTPNLDDKDIDDILDYGQYGKCVYKPNLDRSDDSARVDIITYDKATHVAELGKDLKCDDYVDTNTRASITTIITEFWDCFVKKGTKCTIW